MSTDLSPTIQVIVFSKDRPLQLDAMLRSLILHCLDFHRLSVRIIVKASNELYGQAYQSLEKEYLSCTNITLIPETDFRQQVLHLLEKSEYVLWLVDDNMFVRYFTLSDCQKLLEDNHDALGYSLRLGGNTTYCYALDKQQAIPSFNMLSENTCKYNWTTAEYDFGYPLEVSSSLYRSRDILPLLMTFDFYDPNSLEAEMASRASCFKDVLPCLLCPIESIAFCNPINKVQNTAADNRAGESPELSADSLLCHFLRGERIDVFAFDGFTPNSCHQEVELKLKYIALNNNNNMHYVNNSELTNAHCQYISIIIPCYNQAHFLNDAVNSLLNQTVDSYEIIIVNDGSTDDTEIIANNIIANNPTKLIKLINQKNGGVAAARNAGIQSARYNWLMLLDSDDMVSSTLLYEANKIIQLQPDTDVIYAHMQEFGNANGTWIPQMYSDETILKTNLIPYCAIFKKNLWKVANGYNNVLGKVMQLEDWDFWIRVSKYHPKVVAINKLMFFYRVHGNNIYHSLIHPNFEIARAFTVTANVDLYNSHEVINAFKVISNCNDQIAKRIIDTYERYPNDPLPLLWIAAITRSKSILESNMIFKKAFSQLDYDMAAKYAHIFQG